MKARTQTHLSSLLLCAGTGGNLDGIKATTTKIIEPNARFCPLNFLSIFFATKYIRILQVKVPDTTLLHVGCHDVTK